MGKLSINYVFAEDAGVMGTAEWHTHIQANAEKYATCEIVSLTRVKNLASKFTHEYIQFIVEERITKERTRMYAERGNPKKLDWVSFGSDFTRNPKNPHNRIFDLPLPLTSLTFSKRPTIAQLAEAFAIVTRIGGAYSLVGHSCFWWADIAYEKVKREFGGDEKHWNLIDIGGKGNYDIPADLWSIGMSKLFGGTWKSKAVKFEEEKRAFYKWAVEPPAITSVNITQVSEKHIQVVEEIMPFGNMTTPEETVNAAIRELFQETNFDRYLEALATHDIVHQVDRQLVQETAAAAAQADPQADDQGENADTCIQEFEAEAADFVAKILADPELDINLAAFQASEEALGNEPAASLDYLGPRMEEVKRLEKARFAFLGRLLREGISIARPLVEV